MNNGVEKCVNDDDNIVWICVCVCMMRKSAYAIFDSN